MMSKPKTLRPIGMPCDGDIVYPLGVPDKGDPDILSYCSEEYIDKYGKSYWIVYTQKQVVKAYKEGKITCFTPYIPLIIG